MHLYEVRTSRDYALAVFARNQLQALTIFAAIHAGSPGSAMLPDLSIELLDHSPKITSKRHLVDALAREIVGVGHIDPVHGWTITDVADLGGD